MIGTYHTHTAWSDGKAPPLVLAAAAHEQGASVLGISDHLTFYPSGRQPEYSMKIDELDAYLVDIRQVDAASPITVLPGIEVDWFPDMDDQLRELLEAHEFAYRIGSVHFVGEMCIDCHARHWEKLDQPQRDDVFRGYWERVRAMAQSKLFDIIAHIDLPKKFAFAPTIGLSAEICAALDAIAAAGSIVEINTAGWHKPCEDAYPTLDVLRQCHQRGIQTMISSDAHLPKDLLRGFVPAADRLREAGYEEVVQWIDGEFTPQPIDDAVRGLAQPAATQGLDDF